MIQRAAAERHHGAAARGARDRRVPRGRRAARLPAAGARAARDGARPAHDRADGAARHERPRVPGAGRQRVLPGGRASRRTASSPTAGSPTWSRARRSTPAKEDPQRLRALEGREAGRARVGSPWGRGRPAGTSSARRWRRTTSGSRSRSTAAAPTSSSRTTRTRSRSPRRAAGTPFADLWVHNGMITFGADKMSKSLGNVVSIASRDGARVGEALRLLFYGTHYRAPLDFGPGGSRSGALARAPLRVARARRRAARRAPRRALDGRARGPLLAVPRGVRRRDGRRPERREGARLRLRRMRELNRAVDTGDRATVAAAREDFRRVAAVLGDPRPGPRAFLAANGRAGARPAASARRDRGGDPGAERRRAPARTSAGRTPSATTSAPAASCSRTPRPAQCGSLTLGVGHEDGGVDGGSPGARRARVGGRDRALDRRGR
jgi:hypothetical protein